MKTLLALALLFACLTAHATDVTVACTPPAKRTDNGAIVGALTFNLYGATQGQPKVLVTTTPLAACSSVRANVKVGTSCWDWTAIEARNDLGPVTSVESLHSPETCSIVVAAPPAAPNAPTNPTSAIVTIGPTAYTVIKGPKTLALLPVGTVPLGTACDTSQGVLKGASTFNVVDESLVKYTSPSRPVVVLAQCG